MSQLQPLQQAFRHLMSETINFLPNLIAGVMMLAVGWLISWLVAGGSRRLVRRLRLDEVMNKAGWTDAFSRANVKTLPSEMVARLVFWVLFLFFLVLAVENLGLELTAVPLRAFIEYLPRLLGAVLLLFVGSFVAVVIGSAFGASLARIDFVQHKLFAAIMRTMILIVTFVATVEHLGFDISMLTTTLTNLVTIAAAGLAIAFALGSRDATRNMLAGYYARERFRTGDRLELPDGRGELVAIGTLNSEIELEGGSLVIPNSMLVETAVKRLA